MKNNKKYITTLWENYYCYDGLVTFFSILDVRDELKEANRRLKIFSDKVIVDGILGRKIKEKEEYVEVEIDDYKKEDKFMKIFSPANMHNKVVARIARGIRSKTNPDYDSSSYYLEIVEFPEDAKIGPELFNPDRCKFPVDCFFNDKYWKAELGIISWSEIWPQKNEENN
jgi:hypothetical protein